MVVRGWVRGSEEFMFTEYRISGGTDEKVREMDGGDDCRNCI